MAKLNKLETLIHTTAISIMLATGLNGCENVKQTQPHQEQHNKIYVQTKQEQKTSDSIKLYQEYAPPNQKTFYSKEDVNNFLDTSKIKYNRIEVNEDGSITLTEGNTCIIR